MNNPAQAILWRSLRLTWPALLAQHAGVIVVVYLISLAFSSGIDTYNPQGAASFVLIISITFVYAVALNSTHGFSGGKLNSGFPFRREFSLPVATHTMLFVPIAYLCVMFQVAVFVPGLIVNYLFIGAEVSILPISFLVLQASLLLLTLSWWTNNTIANIAGWFVAFFLIWKGLLIPNLDQVENSWVVIYDSPTVFLLPSAITLAFLLITYFGVKQQRYGGALLGPEKNNQSLVGTFQWRAVLPFMQQPCPTDSPLRAELWKERQLRGPFKGAVSGAIGGFASLLFLRIIEFLTPNDNTFALERFTGISITMYILVCFGFTAYMFGIGYKNENARVSVHDKTTPLSTVSQVSIKISVVVMSTIAVGLAMGLIIWVLGPLFSGNFYLVQDIFSDALSEFFALSVFGIVLRLMLLFIAFYTLLVLVAAFLTWFALHPIAISIGLALTMAYGFLFVIGVRLIFDYDSNSPMGAYVSRHIWLLVAAIPLSLIYMFRELLRDWVINIKQFKLLVAGGIIFECLNLYWLFGENNYHELGLEIESISYLVAQGFLPLATVVFTLWTVNKIRHG
ncbi:MAG: hypothetical protein COA96_18015 [SAR86 cluster bacterium]|uniref:Uncharacterized protein n=1 Tax=SAR86 cluster bacterium TaxID=2030880 RepID=A0A2A5AE53_9GAMM|nr:MAG: hypothetical protein COA96_18015 [SAR86 cluster bacterium]